VRLRVSGIFRYTLILYLQTAVFAFSLFQAAELFRPAQGDTLTESAQTWFSDASPVNDLAAFYAGGKTRSGGAAFFRIKDIRFSGSPHGQGFAPVVFSRSESGPVKQTGFNRKDSILLKLRT